MKAAAVLLGVLASVALVGACGGTSPEADDSEALPAEEAPATGEPAASPPVSEQEPPREAEAPLLRVGYDATCNPEVAAAPCGSGVPVGSHWTFRVYTHCGVEWIYLDGSYWVAEPGLGDVNPPPGWGNPFDDGVITLEATDRATYLSQGGATAQFVRAPAGYQPPLCY
jgi:hypothetical protein